MMNPLLKTNYNYPTFNDDTVENNDNEIIDDVGFVNEYLPEQNNYDEYTVSGGSVYDISE